MKLALGSWARLAVLLCLPGAALAAPSPPAASSAEIASHAAALPKRFSSLQPENPPFDPTLIRQSDKLRTGVLPNGLRYVLAHNEEPRKAVSIRLAFDVGAFDEADEERGAAHFVEHMAFAGVPAVNGEPLSRAFEADGVEFARDLNANTLLYRTLYKLDLPNADPAGLDLSFRWLRQVADGVTFADATVATERGVILAERTVRMTPEQVGAEAVMAFHAPGSRLADRASIEPAGRIAAMSAARLRAFYERWYRPERAVVVVVGDMSPEAMEARIRAAFASWTAKGPPPQRAADAAVDAARGEDVLVRADPASVSLMTACRVSAQPDDPVADQASLGRRMSERLWMAILNRRFTRLIEAPQPPFLRATVEASSDWRGLNDVCLKVLPLNDSWRTAQAAAQAELRRFAAHGASGAEIAEAVDRLRNAYWNETGVDGPSADLASGLAVKTLRGEPMPDEAEGQRVLDLAVGGATPQTVKAAFERDWAGAGPLIAVAAPAPPDAAGVRAAWDEADKAPPPAPLVDEQLAKWTYTHFGWAGRVVRREPIDAGGFVRFTFANGLVVNLKTTDFPEKYVEVRVRFGAGRREVPNGQYVAASLGAGLFIAGGLGRMDSVAIRDALKDHTWSAQLKIADDGFVLSGKTSPQSLETELQLLAAYVTDPGFRTALDARLPTAIDAMYRKVGSDPGLAMSLALAKAVAPDGPNNLPSSAQALQMRTQQFEQLLRPALRDAPLEVTIVGKIDEKQTLRWVSRTFGALPARKPLVRARDDTWFLRFSTRPVGPVRVTLDGPAKAMVEDAWPLFVAGHERRRDEYAAYILARVLHDSLLQRVRQELGKTYTPMAGAALPDRGDQGYLVALLDASPGDVELVQAEIGKTAAGLAGGGFDQAALDDARRPFLAQLDARATTNGWWADVLDGSARDPVGLSDALAARAALEALTLEDVRKAAAQWLSVPPILVTATPLVATAAAGPAAAAR